MDSKENSAKEILRKVMKCYNEEMHHYLISLPDGRLTDSDVIFLILNLTLGISTNIYFSLKEILPTTIIDFDFAKAKLINSLSDSFEEIKKYIPEKNNMPLTVEQVVEIHEK